MADRFNASNEEQKNRAEDRARSAEVQAANASTDEERIKAMATAQAWREIAEQLTKDNEQLKAQLEEAIRQSQVYARKRIDSEAEQSKVQERVQSLKPPKE